MCWLWWRERLVSCSDVGDFTKQKGEEQQDEEKTDTAWFY